MNGSAQMLLTFGLLALAICAVWMPSVRCGPRYKVSPWLILLAGAVVSGVAAGYLARPAPLAIGAFLGTVYQARFADSKRMRAAFGGLAALFALALAMHLVPGFNNPILVPSVRLSTDAAPYTQYLNFDKAVVGLVLLAWLCRRASTVEAWKESLYRAVPIAGVTAVAVLSVAVLLEFVRFDLKWPQGALIVLAVNLFFTCVAEEAFFRGFVQERLAASLQSFRLGGWIAALASGLVFGLAHFAGGLAYVGLATLTGMGCACAYAVTKRIEAPIFVHFAVNAIHFVGFTYPRLG